MIRKFIVLDDQLQENLDIMRAQGYKIISVESTTYTGAHSSVMKASIITYDNLIIPEKLNTLEPKVKCVECGYVGSFRCDSCPLIQYGTIDSDIMACPYRIVSYENVGPKLLSSHEVLDYLIRLVENKGESYEDADDSDELQYLENYRSGELSGAISVFETLGYEIKYRKDSMTVDGITVPIADEV